MDIQELVESLSPIERKILPLLKENDIGGIVERSGFDRVSVLRALEFLSSKKVISLEISKRKIVDLGTNGIHYKKNGLPERQLLYLVEKGIHSIQSAQKESKLSQDEFRAALGVLKKKALIELKNGKIMFSGKKEDVTKKTLEEQFLEKLPLDYDSLSDEERFAFNNFKDRRGILELTDKQIVKFKITKIGKELLEENLSKAEGLLEEITPEMIHNGIKGKRFRRYDVVSKVPKIYGGKRHFVSQATDYARTVWSEMGFKEMSGGLLQSSFWVFDALFTPQDHPARELQDTFFIDHNQELSNKKIVGDVKKAHESGISNSKGWQYSWDEEEAKKSVLRTHTTCLSVQTLAMLRDVKNKQGKFFAVGKCFRNETIDSSHLFEFNQTEGIVVDKNANFQHLLGYLKAFLNKMGFEKIRFRPHFFPYTEPSVEADVYDEKTGRWIEILGAGIFRPEVVVPLLGEWVPVLAWGMGFDRLIMSNYSIKDIRHLYSNDIEGLRNTRLWSK